jgi:diguanylate cyclase (GGDEF)-like protein
MTRVRWGHARMLFSVIFAAGMTNGAILRALTPPAPLRTLTTAREAHSLTREDAAHAYPVHLRAVVTYYDPYIDSRHAALFVQDASGAIFIAANSVRTPVRPGDLVEVTGVSAFGDFAPIVDRSLVHVIGRSHLPAKAPRVSLVQLLTGRYDGQWVEIEGVVNSIREFGKNVSLQIKMSDGSLSSTTLRIPGLDYSHLIDSTVIIHGNAAPVFNRNLQMTGVRLFFPDLKEVRIKEAAVLDPFSIRLLPIDQILRFTPNIGLSHRVHVRGRVSLQWPGRSLCIQDATRGLCVQTLQATPLEDGELVDVIGYPAIGGLTPTLTDATYRSAGLNQPLGATSVTAKQALAGDHDAKLIQIEGKLIGKDRAAKDPTLVLSSGKFVFSVVLADRAWGGQLPVWEEGSTLRVTGVCSVQLDTTETIHEGLSIPASFKVLLRSPGDVMVSHKPSWWTAAHLFPVLATAFAITLCALGWATILKQRITKQTAIIREQNSALKNLSFQDGLTRIANRRKFDQTLAAELKMSARSSMPISLLMIDIDHFKALNDQYGHQRGDECLVRIATALASIPIRSTDLVARYGGEEFAVILPGCDQIEATSMAEQMRTAVLDLNIAHVPSLNHCVSISVGAATIRLVSGIESALLIGMADSALYESKLQGRNKTTFRLETLSGPVCPTKA